MHPTEINNGPAPFLMRDRFLKSVYFMFIFSMKCVTSFSACSLV